MADSGNDSKPSQLSSRILNYASNLLVSARDIPAYVKNISDIGIDFSLIGKKTRIGVSRDESGDFMDDEAQMYNAFMTRDDDVQVNQKETPYFNKQYADRVRFLNVFSTHPEIEYITHQICDEMIVYDENGYFCNLDLKDMNLDEDTKKLILKNFKKMYTLLGFHDGVTAWAYALQWLIEGFLDFEMIYDDLNDPRRVVGFQELRPDTLFSLIMDKEYVKKDKNGNPTKEKGKRKVKIWKQIVRKNNGQIDERVLQDNQIIHISYNKIPGQKGRISYVERLVRSFNLMRTMENTKVAWNVMNSQFRLKMVVPVGTKTTAKAKQALAMITNKYKEDLLIDHDSGEVTINGQAKINFGRNIVLPSRQGQEPDIDGVQYNGPDLSNMDAVRYFERKMWRDSNLPFSRFDRENGAGRTILFNADGIPHDELTFYKFINRLRREFEKIIKQATYIQTILDRPELKIDMELKAKLGIKYESNSLIEEAKIQEIENQKLSQIQTLERLTEIDNRTPIYSKKFLYVDKYELMTEEEWEENERLRDEEMKKSAKRQESSGGMF